MDTEQNRLEATQIAAISQAVSHPWRYAILQEIAAHPALPSSSIHARYGHRPATVSHHLRELQRAGLIETAFDGGQSYFSLVSKVWRAYLRYMSSPSRRQFHRR